MFTFPLFNSFPPEIHALIMDACPTNDLVCLSLTNKHMHSLAGLKQPTSLKNHDESFLCCTDHPDRKKGSHGSWLHRQQCHELSSTENNRRQGLQGLVKPRSKRCGGWSFLIQEHCECFTRKFMLYNRLRSWMPKDQRYCGRCEKFTIRKKQQKGKCYHGREKPRRRREPMYWTHRSRRGGFGEKLWKKWFNNNAMNNMECRLSGDRLERAGSGRYDMRKLKPTNINTQEARDNKSEAPFRR